jgi:hypothetical protein
MRGISRGNRAKERSIVIKGSVHPIPRVSAGNLSGFASKREGAKRERVKKRILDIEKPLSHL